MIGTPLIDDHIATREHVEDYLTRFSGLQAGDLDAALSRHHLLPLKAVYKKLAYMVAKGVVFIGHGLKSDFRIINILVPPTQVVDTVDLFWKPGQRRIGLRFLISYLLRDREFQNFQAETHDSILDAKAALELYLVYKKLRDSEDPNAFSKMLDEIYQAGNRCGWDPETDWDQQKAAPLLPVTPGPAEGGQHGLTPLTPTSPPATIGIVMPTKPPEQQQEADAEPKAVGEELAKAEGAACEEGSVLEGSE